MSTVSRMPFGKYVYFRNIYPFYMKIYKLNMDYIKANL